MNNPQLSRFLIGLILEKGMSKFVAIFHTLTCSFLLITVELWNLLQQDPRRIVDEAILDKLYKQGFLIEAGTDQTAVLESWWQRLVHTIWILKGKIRVTLDCNFACPHCLIERAPVVMSSEAARMVDHSYLKIIKEKKPLRVLDDFSGGEVGTNIDVVYESASRRALLCEAKNIEYELSITTNMSLITRDVVRRLKEVGLKRIRATVFPKCVHDEQRPFRGGGPTYEIVMRRLQEISGMVPIHILTQYRADMLDFLSVPEMMDDFTRRGIAVETFHFGEVLAKRCKGSHHGGTGDPRILLFLNQEAERRGYPVYSEPPSAICGVDLLNHYFIDADTSYIPCAAMNLGERAYGNAIKGIDFVAESQLLKRKLPERCLEVCELAPLCMGGCRLQAETHGNGFDGIHCCHESLRLALNDYITHKAEKAYDPSEVEAKIVPSA
jgi:radical SAM protein with 4Fe4S-binding SPASM domain